MVQEDRVRLRAGSATAGGERRPAGVEIGLERGDRRPAQEPDALLAALPEDADLAWRCRLLGWTSIYVPSAIAQHRRRVTPERRATLPKEINYHGVKNRFLLRINNMTGNLYRRDFWRITKRDAAVIGYVFLREWSSIPALFYIVTHLRGLLRKRTVIQSHVRINPVELEKWFE